MRTKLQLLQRFFQIASVLLGLVVVALVSAVTTMHFAIHGAEVRVPTLRGMTVVEARSQTSGLGLNLEVDNRYYSADVAAGHILSQSPIPGAVVRREWRVRVAESLGPQKVEVPSVVGSQERTAALNLRRVGLETGKVAHLPWSKSAGGASQAGLVLAQDPPAKAQGIERPGINLLVAAEDDTAADGFVMPDLTGLPIVTAQALLTRVGIKSGEPKFVDAPLRPVAGASIAPAVTGTVAGTAPNSAPGPAPAPDSRPAPVPIRSTALPGVVIAQSPPAGFRVEVGSTVGLTVAK
jgi:beta-lactam-binding protein with PASTA domain